MFNFSSAYQLSRQQEEVQLLEDKLSFELSREEAEKKTGDSVEVEVTPKVSKHIELVWWRSLGEPGLGLHTCVCTCMRARARVCMCLCVRISAGLFPCSFGYNPRLQCGFGNFQWHALFDW